MYVLVKLPQGCKFSRVKQTIYDVENTVNYPIGVLQSWNCWSGSARFIVALSEKFVDVKVFIAL
jgi:hypothetical protein